MYKILLKKSVKKKLAKLPNTVRTRIAVAIDELHDKPRSHPNAEPLTHLPDRYRLRIGDYRLIYRVEDDQLVVLVLHLQSRGEAYKIRRKQQY